MSQAGQAVLFGGLGGEPLRLTSIQVKLAMSTTAGLDRDTFGHLGLDEPHGFILVGIVARRHPAAIRAPWKQANTRPACNSAAGTAKNRVSRSPPIRSWRTMGRQRQRGRPRSVMVEMNPGSTCRDY